MNEARRLKWLAGIGAALLLAGCSGGSNLVVRPGRSTPATSTPGPSASPATTFVPVATPPTSAAAVSPQVTVTPASGLPSPASVHVAASGFSPHESLVVNECAAKGTATGMGDCNIAGMQGTTTDSTGKATITFTVTRGPFGGNHIVCSESQPCLVSVSQASLSPTEEADQRISFAP